MREIVRKRILDKYGHECVHCGNLYNLQIDHIVPLDQGGKHDEINFQPLCRTCNMKKGKRIDLYDFIDVGSDENFIFAFKDNMNMLMVIDQDMPDSLIEKAIAKHEELFGVVPKAILVSNNRISLNVAIKKINEAACV